RGLARRGAVRGTPKGLRRVDGDWSAAVAKPAEIIREPVAAPIRHEQLGGVEQRDVVGMLARRRCERLEIPRTPRCAEFYGRRVAPDSIARGSAERAACPEVSGAERESLAERAAEAAAARERRGSKRGYGRAAFCLPAGVFTGAPRGGEAGLGGGRTVTRRGDRRAEQRGVLRGARGPIESEYAGKIVRTAARLLDLRRSGIDPHLSRRLRARRLNCGEQRQRGSAADHLMPCLPHRGRGFPLNAGVGRGRSDRMPRPCLSSAASGVRPAATSLCTAAFIAVSC